MGLGGEGGVAIGDRNHIFAGREHNVENDTDILMVSYRYIQSYTTYDTRKQERKMICRCPCVVLGGSLLTTEIVRILRQPGGTFGISNEQ